jgi:hypothetical protein
MREGLLEMGEISEPVFKNRLELFKLVNIHVRNYKP